MKYLCCFGSPRNETNTSRPLQDLIPESVLWQDLIPESVLWEDLIPETVLLHIFSFLEPQSLLRASRVCCKWHRIARDESLWKVLTRTCWDIQGGQKDNDRTWYMEYKRLFYYAPTQVSEMIDGHADEILDVAFSHDGRFFCTSSKDAIVKVWKVGYPTKLRHSADLRRALNWKMTHHATFNSDDSYLLVCGVKMQSLTNGSEFEGGLGVVFRMKDFRLLQEMTMEPPDLFADWFSDDICVGGYVPNRENNVHFFCIRAFKVITDAKRGISYEEGTELYSFSGDGDIWGVINLLVAKIPRKTSTSRVSDHCNNSVQDTKKDPEVGSDIQFNTRMAQKDHPRGRQNYIKQSSGFNSKTSNCLLTENGKPSTFESKPCGHVCDNCGETLSDAVIRYCADCVQLQRVIGPDVTKQHSASDLQTFDRYLIYVSANHQDAIAFYRVEDLPETLEKKLKDKKLFGNTIPQIVNPTDSIHLPGLFITGMKLSPDHRYLYLNCRNAVYNEEEYDPNLMEDMEVKTIDLQTLQMVPELTFRGHKGFSTFPACYICLDSCQDYVASGSEETMGYLWDRRYQTCLAKFEHYTGVVNGVAFNPVDQECLVTVGDDCIINIWRSRNRQKQLEGHS